MSKKEHFIFGIRPVIEAIKSGKEIDKLLLQKGLRGEGFRELFQMCRELGVPYQFVPPEKLNSLSKQNHQGAIAFLSELTYQKLEDVIPMVYEQGRTPLVLILDRITDVRNLGAIARTAECAGVDALVVPHEGSARINSEAVKTSSGALYKIPVCRSAGLWQDIRFLKESGLVVIAATEKASLEFTSADLSVPMALVLGNEGTGISVELLKMADLLVKIPVLGEIGSLNVSVAAGVLLYEALRQRTVP
jgi:23S rRNA (guanosine2251-2'-O)-methyltransferase